MEVTTAGAAFHYARRVHALRDVLKEGVIGTALGWRAQAPYDAIIVTAGAPEVPEPLVEQLADGGRLVVPVGPRETQVLKIVERRGKRTVSRELKGACFVPLIGRHGWEEKPS